MRIAVAQIGSGENKEMNRYMIERLAWSASEAGADMLFLPEYAMFCAGSDRAARNMEAAEPLDGPFVTALSELAAGQGLWIWRRHGTSRPTACRTTRSSSLMMRGGCAARTAKTAFMMLSAIASRRSAGQGSSPLSLSRPRPAGSASSPAMSCVSRSLQPSRKSAVQKCFLYRQAGSAAKTSRFTGIRCSARAPLKTA